MTVTKNKGRKRGRNPPYARNKWSEREKRYERMNKKKIEETINTAREREIGETGVGK